MTLDKGTARVALVTTGLLLIPLVAMQFTTEVTWTLSDFVIAGGLLFGTGFTYLLVARLRDSAAYRLGVGVAVAAGLLLVWINLAVGFIGSEANPANLLYGGVLAVALTGALVTRFQPRGMARAMFAAVLAQLAVPLLATLIWKFEVNLGIWQVLALNAVFAGMWAASGWLFRRVSTTGSSLGPQLA